MQKATKSLVLALLCAAYCTSSNARLVDLRGTSWEKHSQKECGLDPYLLYAVALTESKKCRNQGVCCSEPLGIEQLCLWVVLPDKL